MEEIVCVMCCYFIALIRFFPLFISVFVCVYSYAMIFKNKKTKHSGKLNIVAHKTEETSNAPGNEGKNGIGKPFLFSSSLVWCGVFAIRNSSFTSNSMCDWFDLLYFTLKLYASWYAFDATSYNTKKIIIEEADNWLCGQRDLLFGCTLNTPLFFSFRSHSLFLQISYCWILDRHIYINVLINRTLYKWKYHTAFRLIIFIIL